MKSVERYANPRKTNSSIIGRLRLERGMTQRHLADKLGCLPKTISRLKHGEHSPSAAPHLRHAFSLPSKSTRRPVPASRRTLPPSRSRSPAHVPAVPRPFPGARPRRPAAVPRRTFPPSRAHFPAHVPAIPRPFPGAHCRRLPVPALGIFRHTFSPSRRCRPARFLCCISAVYFAFCCCISAVSLRDFSEFQNTRYFTSLHNFTYVPENYGVKHKKSPFSS